MPIIEVRECLHGSTAGINKSKERGAFPKESHSGRQGGAKKELLIV
jgi:hypothetical protein